MEFVGDRVSYIVLRGRLCIFIVLNVHSPSEGKVMIQKTVFVRNQSSFFVIILLSTT